jgi:hypothetical protein
MFWATSRLFANGRMSSGDISIALAPDGSFACD